MIARNSRERQEGEGGDKRGNMKGDYGRIWGEEEKNGDYGGMV